MRRMVGSVGLLAVLGLAVIAAAPQPASAHRLDPAAASEIADRLLSDDYSASKAECSRLSDHRFSCSQHHEEWTDEDVFDWDTNADLVLVGSRLYQCDRGRACTRKQKKPIELPGSFVGRTRYGRARIGVEMAARGVGGYFVPSSFDFYAGVEGMEVPVPCKSRDGKVETSELSDFRGHIRDGRFDLRKSYAWDEDDDGVDELHGVQRLTGFATRDRLTAVARLTERYVEGTTSTACSGKQRLSLHLEWKMPHYVKW